MSIESRRRGARRAAAVLGAAALSTTVLPLGVAAPAQAAGVKKADGGAYIKSYRWLNKSKTAFDFVVQSKALGSAQHVRVLLPKGWKKNSRQSWPTVYA